MKKTNYFWFRMEINQRKFHLKHRLSDNGKTWPLVENAEQIPVPKIVIDLLKTKNYTIVKYLGSGKTSIVYLVQKVGTGTKFAAKIINLLSLSHIIRTIYVPNEIRILETTNHPNVLAMIEKIAAGDFIIMILEYGDGGDLWDWAWNRQPADYQLAKEYCLQVTRGLAYLHSKGITHRDIKPENVILCNGVAKISDFTFAEYVRDSTGDVIKDCLIMGTYQYMSPEKLTTTIHDPFIADAYALGITIYFVILKYFPFGEHEKDNYPYYYVYSKQIQHLERMEKMPYLICLFKQLLNPDPAERITPKQALKSIWFLRKTINSLN